MTDTDVTLHREIHTQACLCGWRGPTPFREHLASLPHTDFRHVLVNEDGYTIGCAPCTAKHEMQTAKGVLAAIKRLADVDDSVADKPYPEDDPVTLRAEIARLSAELESARDEADRLSGGVVELLTVSDPFVRFTQRSSGGETQVHVRVGAVSFVTLWSAGTRIRCGSTELFVSESVADVLEALTRC